MNQNSIILLNALPDKKMKFLGNKCLININKHINVLDYHIKIINHIFKKPEIIVVGGFESKKLKKYIDNKYKYIKYIDHDINDTTNIGTSFYVGLQEVNHNNNCLILNTTFIIHNNIIPIIKKHLDSSFVLMSSDNLGTGCIIDNNRISHCYYDLPSNFPLDIIYIHKNDINTFLNLCNYNIQKLFFFEIINICTNNINLKPITIPKKSFLLLDSPNSIQKMKNKNYV